MAPVPPQENCIYIYCFHEIKTLNGPIYKMKKLLLTIFFILLSPVWAGATDYYVKDDGNDSNTGLSDAQAWLTITKVNSFAFTDGDDVYFKCGDTWSGIQLTIDWDGVDGDNNSIIGAYYMVGETETIGVNGDGRPIIEGAGQTVPAADTGLVRYRNQTGGYVTIQDLNIRDSNAYGIEASHSYVDANPQFSYVTINNCYVYRPRSAGIVVVRGNHCLVEDNTVQQAGYNGTGCSAGIGAFQEGTWNTTIRTNTSFGNQCEGIDAGRKCLGTIIEYNVAYDNKNANFYSDSEAGTIFRYNLSYSRSDADLLAAYGWDRTTWGIGVDNELASGYCNTGQAKIYGNLIAGVKQGIMISCEYEIGSGGDPDCNQTDNLIYNNTVIDCDYNFYFNAQDGWSGNEVKNNISYTITAGTNHIYPTAGSPTGITFSHNNFDEDPCDVCNADDNAVLGIPGISKTTGWRALTAGAVDGTEFALTNTSPCIDAGTDLGATYDDTLNLDNCDFTAFTFELLDQDLTGAAWDIGADVFVGETSELRAQWDFEDDPGILVDSTGSYDLTDHGTVVNVAGLGGIWGEAASFNGSDQWLSRAGAAADYGWNTSQQCTVCNWVSPTALPGIGGLADSFSKGNVGTTTFEMSMSVDEDGSPTFYTGYDGTNYDTLTFIGGDMVEGQRYWVCFAINDSGATVEGLEDQETRIRIWDNTAGALLGGAEETPLMTHHWLGGQGGVTSIGSYGSGIAYFWNGIIDSFRFYNRVLSSADMDALRGSDMTISAFFHCDVDKVQIEEETTYNAGDTCYLCAQTSGGNLFFADGPANNIKIGTNMSYPALVDFNYHTGIGTAILQFARVIQPGDRDSDLQAEGVAEDVGLIHGATKLTDVGGTEIIYTLPQTDPAGGNIIIAAPGFFDIGTGKDISTLAGFVQIDYDWLRLCDDTLSAESYTMTASNVRMFGAGNLRSMDALVINGNNNQIRCIDWASVTDNGSGNRVIEHCVYPTHTTILRQINGGP